METQTTHNAAGQRPEDKWPGILFAYDFVKPSYDWMATRLEAAVSRSQALLTFAATITLGFPVLGAAVSRGISFRSIWFLVAIASFFALVVAGLVARHTGDLVLLDPGELYRRCASMSEWEFKRQALYYAGEAFDENVTVTNRKMRLGTAMSVLLVVETLSFLVWLVTQSYGAASLLLFD